MCVLILNIYEQPPHPPDLICVIRRIRRHMDHILSNIGISFLVHGATASLRTDRPTERFNKCTNSDYTTIGYSSTLVSSCSLYCLSPNCQHVRLDLALVRSLLNPEESVLTPMASPGVRDQLEKEEERSFYTKMLHKLSLRSF